MTERSKACDISDFDGKTSLVGSDDNEYIFISGFESIKFTTDDKNRGFISLMGNNMISAAIAVGEKYTYFLSDHYEFIKNEELEE